MRYNRSPKQGSSVRHSSTTTASAISLNSATIDCMTRPGHVHSLSDKWTKPQFVKLPPHFNPPPSYLLPSIEARSRLNSQCPGLRLAIELASSLPASKVARSAGRALQISQPLVILLCVASKLWKAHGKSRLCAYARDASPCSSTLPYSRGLAKKVPFSPQDQSRSALTTAHYAV